MRRNALVLAVLAGIALLVAAFLTVVTKEGGNIAMSGGNVPPTVGGLDSWVAWVLLGAGALVLLDALALFRFRSWPFAALLFLGGAVAGAVGIWALADPRGFFAQASALQIGEDAGAVAQVLDEFNSSVTAGIGAWIAAIGGAVAALLGIVFVFAPGRADGMNAVTPVAGTSGAPGQRETLSPPVAIDAEEVPSADEPPATQGVAAEPAEELVSEPTAPSGTEPAESEGDVPAEPPPTHDARRSPPDAEDWR